MAKYKIRGLVETDHGMEETFDGPFETLTEAIDALQTWDAMKQGAEGVLDRATIDRIDAGSLND